MAAALFIAAAASVALLLVREPQYLARIRQRFDRAHPAATADDPVTTSATVSTVPTSIAPTTPTAPPSAAAAPEVSATTAPSAAPAAPSASPPAASASNASHPIAVAKPATPPRPRAVPAPPPRATGYLTVICVPACDDVLDGARWLGESPLFRAVVGVGVHHLTLVTSDPKTEKEVTVTVEEDETTAVREEME